jgi:hypothetical protein
MFIRFLQKRPDFFPRGGGPERAHKTIVPQFAGDIFQGTQMIAGTILRRNEEDKDMNRFSIQTIEADASFGNGDVAHKAFNACVLGVGNGDTATDSGRSQ